MVVRVAMVVGVVVVGLAKPSPSAARPATAHAVGAGGEARPAPREAPRPHVTGPRLVALGDSAEIDLPAGMTLYDRTEAQRFLRGIGEPSDDVIAIVRVPGAEWSVIVSYADAGYIDDADASELDAGDLLAGYRAQHERRKTSATSAVVIDGWAEPPSYDRAQHRLAWGIAAHTAGTRLVNSFTRILGRGGYLSVSLIDAADTIERSTLQARSIVQATRFMPGARYEDHAPGDRRSTSGLRGMVAGSTGAAAASQLDVLTQAMLVLKNATLCLLLGTLAFGGLARRRFRRRPRAPTASADRLDDATDAAAATQSGIRTVGLPRSPPWWI
jgi:uncharacterized membrane-anchored protein